MKKQKENSLENITWSEMGKQNVQAKEVYSGVIVLAISNHSPDYFPNCTPLSPITITYENTIVEPKRLEEKSTSFLAVKR